MNLLKIFLTNSHYTISLTLNAKDGKLGEAWETEDIQGCVLFTELMNKLHKYTQKGFNTLTIAFS